VDSFFFSWRVLGGAWLKNACFGALHLNSGFNEIADNCFYAWAQFQQDEGENMRHKALPALTMIEAAGLIGITHARSLGPSRDYRDRPEVDWLVGGRASRAR
jgi:hypothetical protein